MIILLNDNVISSLGFTTEENYNHVKQGVCGLRRFDGRYGLPEPFMASEIDEALLEESFMKISAAYADLLEKSEMDDEKRRDLLALRKSVKYTKLEKAAIVSIAEALKGTTIDTTNDNEVLFILSTTKGNVFLLDENEQDGYRQEQLYLWYSAKLISAFFGNRNAFVVSNACISGASALITAQRELYARRCKYAIVTGVDVLSGFIVAGFQSFKALSPEVCKPFDVNRTGLNIGEAVATMILTERPAGVFESGDIEFTTGAMRNDANHISGPSRTGDGAYLALNFILEDIDPEEIAFVCAHGTATPYNDEMESVALNRAGLQDAPVYSLKGYFGHTLGAAGVLESVISVHALKEGTLLKTLGCDTPDVACPLDIVMENRKTTKHRFIKMLSGFGGCNATLLFTKLN